MRSAGCIVNDIIDRNLDGYVTRTAQRPLVAQTLSLKEAFYALGGLLTLSLGILLQFNLFTIGLGVCSLLLVVLYPFMKRVTYWPQAVLGLAFNWGVLMGWAAIHQNISLSVLVLYGAGICWTLGYDTIYAVQDREDDLKVGIKSTALKWGAHTLKWVGGFYGLMLALLLILGVKETFGNGYYFMVILTGVSLWHQLATVVLQDPSSCFKAFNRNIIVGFLIFIAILVA